MAVIHRHDFTGSDGTEVAALGAPTTGSAHTKVSGSDMLIVNNRAYCNGTTNLYSTVDIPTYPYIVRGSVRLVSIVENSTTHLRLTGGSATQVVSVKWNAAGSVFRLGGTTTAISVSAGNTYEMMVVVHNSTRITCYFDGVIYFPAQAITDIGTAAAVRYRCDDAAISSTTGAHFDFIEVENITASKAVGMFLLHNGR